jgi:predicted transcriptional regulator
MYTQVINKLGLSRVQSEILNSLLINGPDKASNIAKKIKRPLGVAYKGLEELINLKLVLRSENQKKVSIYSAEHPSYLESVIEQKERRVKKERQEFINNLPDLISAYNLVSNKPGVRFYEGE